MTIKAELHTKTLMTKRLGMILMTRMKNKIHAETIVAIMMTMKFKIYAKTMTTKMMMIMTKIRIHGETLMTKMTMVMTIKIKIIQKRW